ncbi:hypothetical protein KSD_16950 [Ktedonobacter sp. SOSP1-85]|nr:hypothetical protein KSD_16950 [Ktedonobacter sp. SOSP1-85]
MLGGAEQALPLLIYDLERQVIVGLVPRPSVFPVLALGLQQTGKWEPREEGLWLRTEYWPPKRDITTRHLPPPAHPSLSPAQREEAITLFAAARHVHPQGRQRSGYLAGNDSAVG